MIRELGTNMNVGEEIQFTSTDFDDIVVTKNKDTIDTQWEGDCNRAVISGHVQLSYVSYAYAYA